MFIPELGRVDRAEFRSGWFWWWAGALRRGQVWLAAVLMVGLLAGHLRGQALDTHPLASLSRRLPEHGPLTHLADFEGQPLALFGDPEGRGLRLGGPGEPVWVATGLPGIEHLAGGSGPWLARAAGKLWYGTDGRTWVESMWTGPREANQLRRLNGIFYAWSSEYYEYAGPGQSSIFHGPRLYRSLDGIDWQEIILTVLSRRINNIRDVFYHDGRYLLSCYGTTLETGNSVGIWCLTSEDGLNWNRVEGINFHTTGAAFGGGTWLLTGQGYGKFAVSSDGVNWTTHMHSFISHYLTSGIGIPASPVYSDMSYPVWIGSGFHCLTEIMTDRPVVAVSRDGITWKTAEPFSWDDTPGALAHSNPFFSPGTGGLSAIGGQAWWWGDSTTVWSSNDWIWGGTRALPEESGDFFSAAASTDRVVALADNGRVAISDDGRSWTFHDLPGDVVPSDMVWAADLGEFLAVGDRLADTESGRTAYPQVWRSTDGRTWGVRRFPAPISVRSITRGMGKYVAVADRSMPYSSDGVEWHGFTPLQGEARFRDVAFGGDRLLVVDERGGLRLSLDGVAWNPIPTPFRTAPNAGSIAVSHTGDGWLLTGQGVSYFSADLVEWISTPPGISYAQGEFIDDTGFASSTDAQTWHVRRPSSTLSDAGLWHPQRVAFGKSVLTFGRNGQISQTGDWRDYVGEWKGRNFSEVELAQPAIAGDDADPDQDGLDNLLEYALGLNPKRADAQNAVTFGEGQLDVGWGTPQPTTKFSFPSWKDSYGVKFRVEYSDDLVVWNIGDPEAHRISEASTTTGIRDRLDIHHLIGSKPSKWMRLRASR